MNARLAVFALATLAAVLPWFSASRTRPETGTRFPGWTQAPVRGDLSPGNLGPRERRFAEQFPGRVGVFEQGRVSWVIRWVDQPTRKLHPAGDCLRGAGFTVAPAPAWQDADGTIWASCTARRDSERYRVCERILDANGRVWADVSAWYWAALIGRSQGPWWALTRIEPQPR
ncbi:hypothetical protein DB347_22885 [Opitutaceae bacterium EW11]|nr:hypothetical protein DB347_22885 [Opitutaceae bacterium EW11]